MKIRLFTIVLLIVSAAALAQPLAPAEQVKPRFFEIKSLKATPVKNQAMTGTCWCFSTTSLLESDELKKGLELDLSEMYTVRNIYTEKAKNYVLRLGHAQFGEGGLSPDMVRSVATYGAMPESAYSGLLPGQKMYNHAQLFTSLKKYLDSILKKEPLEPNWLDGYTKILDEGLGVPPAQFNYNGKAYTPQSYAKEILKFSADDYVGLTSFTHQPYYKPFVLQVPDNFANNQFYNLPLDQLIDVVKTAVDKGFTVAWDADVSNKGFMQGKGLALLLDPAVKYNREDFSADMQEQPYDATLRQQLYENLTTQDDHLMHITGVEKSKDGKTFFIVKNSWGLVGPFDGYINVSEAYFAINTVSLVLPKAALSKDLMSKLHL